MSEKIYEKMPESVLQGMQVSFGVTAEEAEKIGQLGQDIRDAALDAFGDSDTITVAEIAQASLACQMASVWLAGVAQSEYDKAQNEETES